MNLVQTLRTEKLVAIIRGITGEKLDYTVQALVDGGIRLIEVTMNTPHATKQISRLRERHGTEVHIGAGTVLDVSAAKEAIEAGATYLISPNVQLEVISFAKEQGVEIWPGAMTPTEIVQAYQNGANAVKVFPVSFFGPKYIQALRGPLDDLPLIAVGGVKIEQFQAYLKAGATAIGVGDHLIDREMIQLGQFTQLTQRAKQFVDTVKFSS